MAILKCKMCGGDIVVNEEKTFGACDYCGSTMTLPKVSDDQRAARFNRGNHFRRQGDFDKALAVYETIVNEDEADAEAHWCCALCRFGIEYVEDPNTYEYLPTCHRVSFDSFLEDPDYLAALEHSDGITRRQYQKDAAKIAEVQRGILATSQNEEPFDVFICYKETDDNTKERTRDSLDAQDIYYQLTQEGYRVFFARITLEDKVGAEYEPYIFAALNSAKVMIALGSKPEYFNAVWVKNEWSRFLAMMRKDRSKLLLPCYKDMDPYDLPEQLGVLQSYDMSKIGFMQDLIRGVKKVLRKDEPKPQTVTVNTVNTGSNDIAPLLRRMFMYLEDGEWDKANEYSERVLDKGPENAEAYVGKLMVDLKVRRRDDLKNQAQPFNGNKNYNKAVRFADEKLKNELNGYIKFINDRNAEEKRRQEEERRRLEEQRKEEERKREEERHKQAYSVAVNGMKRASTEQLYLETADQFDAIDGYKDSNALAKECREKAEVCRKDTALEKAKEEIQKDTLEGYCAAKSELSSISGWKDADEKLEVCKKRISKIEAENEKKARIAAEKKKKKIITISSVSAAVVVLAVALVIVLTAVIIPNMKYNAAMELYNAEEYFEAISAFEALNGYKDSNNIIKECKSKTGIDSIKYTLLDDGTAEITGLTDPVSDVMIPSVLDGYTVSSIGNYAFFKCENLKSVTIGASVTNIVENAFNGCSDLTEITVDSNNTAYCSIDGNLYDKTASKLIQYSIGSKETSFTIPDSVTIIGEKAFYRCSNLESVTIGNSLTDIGNSAFLECKGLTSVMIPESVKSIGEIAFASSGLTSVVIPDSVTSIGEGAFSDCMSLTSATVGNSVTSISDSSFNNCVSLNSVTIGNSVTRIGDYAFSRCESLKTVTIPNSVKSIGDNVFYFMDLVVYGSKGSAAETYANDYGIEFREI